MHDLHEADKILKLILNHAFQNNLKKVTMAEIELGSVIEHGDEISAENLEFNIKMLAKNTLAENLEIKINKVKGDSWVLKEIQGE